MQHIEFVTECPHNLDGIHATPECWSHDASHTPTPECWCEGNRRVEVSAIDLNKIIHDLQDEHGFKTRHDMGLMVMERLAAGAESGELCHSTPTHGRTPYRCTKPRYHAGDHEAQGFDRVLYSW